MTSIQALKDANRQTHTNTNPHPGMCVKSDEFWSSGECYQQWPLHCGQDRYPTAVHVCEYVFARVRVHVFS